MKDRIIAQKERILEESSETILKYGVRSFTIDAFSRALGISKKTIYKFFPTKEDLLIKSAEYFTGRMGDRIEKIIQSEINPAIQFVNVMQLILDQSSKVSAERIADVKTQYPKVWKKIEDFRLARRDDFYTILSKAQKEGYVRKDVEVNKVATMYMELVNSTFQPEFYLKNNFAPDEAIRLFLKIITSGLFTESGMEIINQSSLIK